MTCRSSSVMYVHEQGFRRKTESSANTPESQKGNGIRHSPGRRQQCYFTCQQARLCCQHLPSCTHTVVVACNIWRSRFTVIVNIPSSCNRAICPQPCTIPDQAASQRSDSVTKTSSKLSKQYLYSRALATSIRVLISTLLQQTTFTFAGFVK
jgi:hypothetical protein